jgi:hypothetical protein
MIIVTEKALKESVESDWLNFTTDSDYSKPKSITVYYGIDSRITVSSKNAKFIANLDSISIQGRDFMYNLERNAVMYIKFTGKTVSIGIKNTNTRVDFSY